MINTNTEIKQQLYELAQTVGKLLQDNNKLIHDNNKLIQYNDELVQRIIYLESQNFYIIKKNNYIPFTILCDYLDLTNNVTFSSNFNIRNFKQFKYLKKIKITSIDKYNDLYIPSVTIIEIKDTDDIITFYYNFINYFPNLETIIIHNVYNEDCIYLHYKLFVQSIYGLNNLKNITIINNNNNSFCKAINMINI